MQIRNPECLLLPEYLLQLVGPLSRRARFSRNRLEDETYASPKPCEQASPKRSELVQLILSVADDTIIRLRYLVPRTGEVDDRFRDDEPCLVGCLLQARRSGYISRTERMSVE